MTRSNAIEFSIEFGQATTRGKAPSYPFRVVLSTRSRSVEAECKKRWPRLMTHREQTPKDNADMGKMRSFISSSLQQADRDDVHAMLYDRGWMAPFEQQDGITSCKLTRFDCKMWSDPSLPYIEAWGSFTVSVRALVDAYFKRGWTSARSSGGVASETAEIALTRSVPLLLRYTGSSDPLDAMLAEVEADSRKPGTHVSRALASATRFRNVHEFRKEVAWGFGSQAIEFRFTDAARVLAAKARRNPIGYALGALAVGKALGAGRK